MFFIIGFVFYTAAMIAAGWYLTKGKTSDENFLTAGRSLPVFLLLSTTAATMISTTSSIGATANGFRLGWGGSVYGLGGAAGMAIMLLFVDARRKEFLTMSEEAQYYYGGNKYIRAITGIMMFVAEIIWLGNHINGGSKYLAYVTGLSSINAKLVTVLAFTVYVYIGGYLAVVWTDAIQLVIIIAGFITIASVAIPAAGGMDAIRSAYQAVGKPAALTPFGIFGQGGMGLMAALTLVVSACMGVVGAPAYRTRVYTAATVGTVKKAFIATAVIFLTFSLLPSIIGMSAFTIATRDGAANVLGTPDFAFSYMATVVLGPAAGLIFLIAGLSATMSSGDSDVISGVTILLTDVYPTITREKIPKTEYKKYSRITLVCTILFAFVATLYANDIIDYINNVVGSLLPGLAVMMLLGKLWKRATWQGGIATVLTGMLFGVLFLTVKPFSALINGMFAGPSIPATLITLAAGIVVSLMTPPSTVTEAEALRMVMAGREGNSK